MCFGQHIPSESNYRKWASGPRHLKAALSEQPLSSIYPIFEIYLWPDYYGMRAHPFTPNNLSVQVVSKLARFSLKAKKYYVTFGQTFSKI